MKVRVEQAEPAHTTSLHLTNAPFSMFNFCEEKKKTYTSKAKRFKAAHLNEVIGCLTILHFNYLAAIMQKEARS